MFDLSFLAKILFVGHSLVGPDLPDMVETGLRLMNVPATVEAQVINGAPLRVSLSDGATAQGVDARAELAKGETDVLILTEATPLADQVQWNDTVGNITKFSKLATDARPEARVYQYETWPDRTGLRESEWLSKIASDLSLWEKVVYDGATAAGHPVKLIPVAQAFAKLSAQTNDGGVSDIPDTSSFFSDGIHLSERGKYFVSLVHLAVITGKSPVGLPPKLTRSWGSRDQILTTAQAKELQEIAWAVVSTYVPSPPQVSAEHETSVATVVEAPPSTVAETQKLLDLSEKGISNPNLALGLNGLADWSVQVPFLNLMKMSREWTGHLPGQYGGWDHAKLEAAGALDAQGWLKEIPPELQGVSTLILTDLPPDTYGVTGRYTVTWKGEGELQLGGRAQNVEMTGSRATFDFTPGSSGVEIMIRAVKPGNPIRDIVIVRADREALLDAGKIFNPDWLDRIKGVRTIRFMDWMQTNGSFVTSVENRPKLDDYTWTRKGAPIEVMIALSNELKANPWFNIPHLAQDDLVRLYAQKAFSELDAGLIANVEYSNEVWNWSFAQAKWAEERGKERWGREATWIQYYALRASEVMDIWSDVYGEEGEVRLKRILATQTGWLGLEDQILYAPEVMAEGKPAPATHFDAYAVTGYFSGMLGSSEKLPTVKKWINDSVVGAGASSGDASVNHADTSDHKFDAAIKIAAQELKDGSITGDPADTLSDLLGRVLPYQANVAKKAGLELIMYEGGTHVVGLGQAVDDPDVTAFFQALNYSPEMGLLYQELMAGWASLTPAPFNAFVDVSAPSKWGSWGGLRHLGDTNPRWTAISTGCQTC